MDLDAQVRATDFDRWASSRLVADEHLRRDLVTLYAFEAELMAIPAKVSQPLLAQMRYTWWSDQLDGVFAGEPRKGHPVLERLSSVVRAHGVQRAVLDALIEAHIGRIQGQPHNLGTFFVGPMREAVRILGGPGDTASTDAAGEVWGLTQTGRFDEAARLRSEANRGLRGLPVRAFPAVAHAALRDPAAPEAIKRLRLAGAAFVGRV